jgi:hypothetical protein
MRRATAGSLAAFVVLAAAALPGGGCRRSSPLADGVRDGAVDWELPGGAEEMPADTAGETTETVSEAGAGAEAAPPEDMRPASQAVSTLGDRLVVWLDAGKSVEPRLGSLSMWTDQSGRGNHAINPTAGSGPTPALELDAINGLPAVQFAADTDRLIIPDSASLHFGLDDVIAAVVLKHQSAVAPYSRIVLSKPQPVEPFDGLGLLVNFEGGFGAGAQIAYRQLAVTYTPPSGTFADNVARLYVFRRAENALELRVNGRSVGLTSALRGALPVDLTNAANLNIGGPGSAFQALRGSIAEIVIVRGSVAGAELAALEEYLVSKYRL